VVAQRLAERFWPGPLTFVVKKNADVPDEVTAGGPTVAVRCPAHPVARQLLAAVGTPLAAPSANRSTQLSPTTAQHVESSLGDDVALIIDGGPCTSGIESTVLDVTVKPPCILRPGPITVTAIAEVIGVVLQQAFDHSGTEVAKSPGLMERHYAPRTPLELAQDDGRARAKELRAQGLRVGWLTWPDAPPTTNWLERTPLRVLWDWALPANGGIVFRRNLPRDPVGYAAGLYAALHELDSLHIDRIVAATVPDGPDWDAARDRLLRASAAPGAS
jgi:L-threonylcarbamoyladenylate synthase